jgi:hypothetical protein
VQLLRAGRILAKRIEQKLRINLDDSKEIIELMSNETGGLVCLFEIMGPDRQIGDRRRFPVLAGAARDFFQDDRPRSTNLCETTPVQENNWLGG